MEKEVDPDVIKSTQSSLGKYVKRPPLTEKLLKKPPFRFLHDIVTTVLKTTGFFEGLFEEQELVSDNVKDRESKIVFLNKVITVLGATLGNNISAKPTKIVAGQEPEKTNELLQSLAQALDKKLSSDEAVKRFKEAAKGQGDIKTKEPKTVKKTNDTKSLTSKSSEKLSNTNKKETRDKSQLRNEKEKSNVIKLKQKDTIVAKKESPPKRSTAQQPKILPKKNSVEKITQNENENKKSEPVNNISHNEEVITNNAIIENADKNSGVSLEKQDLTESTPQMQQLSPGGGQEEQGTLNTSYTIGENELNSSLSSQDLMDVDNSEANQDKNNQGSSISVDKRGEIDYEIKGKAQNHEKDKVSRDHNNKTINSAGNNSRRQSFTTDADKLIQHDNTRKGDKVENATYRPKSVRPSSSRPGAPRLREKHDNLVSGNENLLVGKVNIIAESSPNEEDEDSSVILVEQQNDSSPISNNKQDLQLTSNQHGALVQQILESQKEFSQIAGKTEIEWQFGAQKAREAVNQEIEQVRFNIQALSRVANPLGKVLDHIQEDVEVMRQELQQWTKTYEEASKELLKQKTANEDSLFPLHTKLKLLDANIREKRDKINDLKIVIHKNSSRIEKLLAGGDVQ